MIRDGYTLWQSRINQAGGLLGRPVDLILYDDRSDPETVRERYLQLVTKDQVDLLLSPYGTPLTLIASEVAEQHEKILIACAASGEKIWDRGFKGVFGVYALASRYFVGLMDLMARNGFDTLAILHEQSPFNLDVAEGTRQWASRFGVTVPFVGGFTDGAKELPSLLKAARATNPRGLILSAYPNDCYRLLAEMKQAAYRPPILAMTIAPVHPDFAEHAGEMADGVFGPSQWEADERIPFPGTRQFILDFKMFAGKTPSYHAGAAFAACQILERAVTRTRSLNRDNLRDFILSLDTVTVIGRFKVDYKGRQIGHNPILIQWQDGKKEIVYPTKMQTARPRF